MNNYVIVNSSAIQGYKFYYIGISFSKERYIPSFQQKRVTNNKALSFVALI
jgi:hypothetical protein